MLLSESDYLPAFEFTEGYDHDDNDDGGDVENDIKKKDNQDIPPSYDDGNKGECVVDMQKKRCNSYVVVKTKVLR